MSFSPRSSGPCGTAPDDGGSGLPEQSREDTDAGWGEYAVPDDDERLRRERPPHWDDY